MKSKNILMLMGLFLIQGMMAQDEVIQLFPNGAPGEAVELIEKASTDGSMTGGKSVLRITNVSDPTITIFRAPEEKATGTAMLVCPGGGYNILAYDLEGNEICNWLNKEGITAILLKYRVPRRKGLAKHTAPLQDAQRALCYVRSHAAKWNIKPDHIGVMGFSAGGHLSAMLSNSSDSLTYTPIDGSDKVSSRPDFCLLVYPAYLSGDKFELVPEVHVTENTPPTMLVQAEDDSKYIDSSLFYYYALKEAGVPACMHLYNSGGHGYGLRDTGATVNEWPARAADWFKMLDLIPRTY